MDIREVYRNFDDRERELFDLIVFCSVVNFFKKFLDEQEVEKTHER